MRLYVRTKDDVGDNFLQASQFPSSFTQSVLQNPLSISTAITQLRGQNPNPSQNLASNSNPNLVNDLRHPPKLDPRIDSYNNDPFVASPVNLPNNYPPSDPNNEPPKPLSSNQ